MIKKVFSVLTFLALAGTAQAAPITFNFSCDASLGSDCAGDEGGSITLTTSDLGGGLYDYNIEIDNVSIAALVTGFGFDFTPDFDVTQMSNFSMERWNGSSYEDVSANWQVSEGTQSVSAGTSFGGVFLDFIDFDVDQTQSVNQYALGNLTTLDGIASFTSTQNMTASGALLRLQRTGENRDGSLKLVDSTTTVTVSEPATLGLLGLGLIGFGMARRRKI